LLDDLNMTASNQISVLSPLFLGVASTLFTIIIHGLMLGVVISQVRRDLRVGLAGIRFWTDLMIVTGATVLALAAHLVEMGAWALVFDLCGEFPDFAAAFYHSAVNYTTLGYGDVVMSARWRLLGPLEAADGMLMFGVSTAMIFAVVERLLQVRFGPSDRQSATTPFLKIN
jgi:hypothetical protein